MITFQKFLARYGWTGFVRLCFYPVTGLVTTPIRLVQTLSASRVLARDRWHNYPHFNAHMGLLSLFYWSAALNLYRFGRSGRSRYVALGDYPLSRWFFYSLPSLYSYWTAGAVTVLMGMFGWWLSHLVWISDANAIWVLLVMGLALSSTTFYASTFGLHNYNVLGWAFFPIGLYAMGTGLWVIAGLAWLAASFCSFTVVFLAGILSLVAAFNSWKIVPVLTVLPAILKLLTHLWPFLIDRDLKTLYGHLKTAVMRVMKAIGLADCNVKYQRTTTKQLGLCNIYYLFIYGQFCLVSILLTGDVPNLVLTGLTIFLVNSTYVRIADEQSMYMLMFSLATFVVMGNPKPWLLLSYWILVSPLPFFAGFPSIRGVLDVVPKVAPFTIKPFLEGMEKFLSPVGKGERVLMAFDNPGGVYEKVFDGYRVLLDLSLYVAAKRKLHFMPDWWGVFELNYNGAPEFWGRDVASVQKNAEHWNADYVVVYQNTGTELEAKWQDGGFKVLSKFSWAEYENCLDGQRPYPGEPPTWWLLKNPGSLAHPHTEGP